MRFLVYIFSIYVLALSAMPCNDAQNVCQNNKVNTEVSQTHSHGNDRDDVCSPFCSCSCCSASINLKLTLFVVRDIRLWANLAIKFTNRDSSIVSNNFGIIWQPPKING